MEKETVLEIEFQPVFDKWAWKITKQNEEILERNVFKDEELNVESFESPEFRKLESKLFIKGYAKKDDDNIQICTTEEKALIEIKVKAINEKYGIKKRWRAEYGKSYCYMTGKFQVSWDLENNHFIDDKNYKNGNYFETEKEALEYAEHMKKKSLEWHEMRDNNE